MKRLLFGFSILLISIGFSGCGDEEIGFKGLYLNGDKEESCEVIKQYAEDNKGKFINNKYSCSATASVNYNLNYLTLKFNKNEKVSKIIVDSHWGLKIFPYVTNLNKNQFKEYLIDNLSWLDELVEEKQSIPFSNQSYYNYVQKTDDWKFTLTNSFKITVEATNKVNLK